MNEYMKFNLRHNILVAAVAVGSFVLSAGAQADQAHYADGRAAPAYRNVMPPMPLSLQTQRQYKQSHSSPLYAQNTISYAQAKSIALRSRPGSKYVSMRLNGNIYIVRLETPNGRVVDVRVDATTGRVR